MCIYRMERKRSLKYLLYKAFYYNLISVDCSCTSALGWEGVCEVENLHGLV